MINRDALEVIYTVGEGDDAVEVTVNGILHRRTADRGGSNTEAAAGTIHNDRLRIMIEVNSMNGNPPAEGTPITVGGVAYRCDAPEVASDLSHIVVQLLDPNG